MPLKLAFLFCFGAFAQAFVLKHRPPIQNEAQSSGAVRNANADANVPPFHYNVHQAPGQEDSEDELEVESLLIRMFEPSDESETKDRPVSVRQKHHPSVDVDILAERRAEEGNALAAVVDGPGSGLGMAIGEGREKADIRRKPSALQRQPNSLGRRKAWTLSVKRKTVKLPPLHFFPVPARARAAPLLRAESFSENLLGETTRRPASAREGRQFWVNALKTLLMEFRRMHPDIASGAVSSSDRKRNAGEEAKRAGGEEQGQWAGAGGNS